MFLDDQNRFPELVPLQKHQFEQLSVHENTIARAEDCRLETTAPGWSIEITKDTLKRAGRRVDLIWDHNGTNNR